ncbi:MAG: release factor glutamine methyltransferase [Candidatus Hepatoplasma scabrum]|nr:MAG: release factor glutamine methyltransferase [Candidatus Hepatoplasma sp.]
MIFNKKKYSWNDLVLNKDLSYQNKLNLLLITYFEKDHFFYFDKKEQKLFSIIDYLIIKQKLQKLNKQRDLNLICHKKNFYNLSLKIKKGVFIPQYDTEGLIDLVLENEDNKKGLEIGVGTGAITLAIIKNSNNIMDGIDISKKAIKLTKLNQNKNNLTKARINFFKKDLFKLKINQKYDFIVANPPYVAFNDLFLTTEVKKIQPKKALFAAENGFLFYKYLIKNFDKFLNEDGTFYFEIGIKQELYLKKYLLQFKNLTFYFAKDLNNIVRFLIIKKSKEK